MAGLEIAANVTGGRDAPPDSLFWLKSRLLMLRRAAANALAPDRAPRRRVAALPACAVPDRARRAPALHIDRSARAAARNGQGPEFAHRGRRDRRARRRSPGETFSFWRAAGRATRARGYVIGRELRQGCMIPTIGGGLCQLTNALSRVAHQAGPGDRRAAQPYAPARGLLHRRRDRRHRLLELYRFPLPQPASGRGSARR